MLLNIIHSRWKVRGTFFLNSQRHTQYNRNMRSSKLISLLLAALILIGAVAMSRYVQPSSGAGAGSATADVSAASTWGNSQTLQDHFDRHGADFKAVGPADYAAKAHAFYLASKTDKTIQVKVDKTGVIRVYDARSNSFGSYNADGTTKTFFKPNNGQAYFDSQPGK